jgi:ABC-type glycerol-3-phosphate transport system substrate-binding protein
MNMMKMMVAAALSAGALSASGADGESAKFESKYYKDWPMFSTYARETEEKQPIEHHPRSVNYERAREKQILISPSTPPPTTTSGSAS